MFKKALRFNWDAIGLSASFLCAVHCVFVPLLLTAFPILGFSFLESETSEYLFIGGGVLIAVVAILKGYYQHKKTLPLFTYIVSVILFALGFLVEIHVFERTLHIAGAVFIVVAHIYNWKYHRKFPRHP